MTLLRLAVALPALYLEACLALWGLLALLPGEAWSRLAAARAGVARLWTAFRLGAGVTVLCLQPSFAEMVKSGEGWALFSAAAAALFIQVSTPNAGDLGQDWADVVEKPLYPQDRPLRAAIYRRVSTLEQEEEGHSLDEQLERAKRYVKNQGWVLVEVYTDVYSGKSGKRRALRKLEKAVLAGEVDVVVIDRIDRLYRNLAGLLRLVSLFQENEVALVSVSEQIGFDTRWGRLVLMVLGALAEFYLDSLAEETRKGKRARARKGLANGAYRFGVCNGLCSECTDPNGEGYCPHFAGENRGDGRVPVHHPIEVEAVRLMYRWYATGDMSYADIAWRINARLHALPDGRKVHYRSKGQPGRSEPGPFTDDAVRYIVSNPFYKGRVGYGGVKANGKKERKPVELFDGQHDALVDEETWNRCREIRRRRRHRPDGAGSPARTYPLSRLLFCNRCKGSMRAFSSNNAQNRYYGDHLFREKWRGDRKKRGTTEEELEANLGLAYDHQPNVAAEVAEEQVQAIVGQIELPVEWKQLILAYLSDEGGLSSFQRQKLEVYEQMRRANERYTAAVAPISRWEVERIERECLAQLERLERMLPPGTDEPDVWPYLDDLGQLWAAATWEEQNQLIGQICSAIYVEDEDVVRLVAYPAFHELLDEAAGRAAGKASERGVSLR
ncbi:MAG TPA: recombinase family protein [Anaerolineae bacterium]|nr:recombinase family protein [Anaerolineae bacterium]